MGGKRGYKHESARPYSGSVAPDAELNSEIIAYSLELDDLPRLTRAEYADPAAVRARCRESFEVAARHGIKPTVNGFAHALGITRQELGGIVNGWGTGTGSELGLTQKSISEIKKSYAVLAETLEASLMESKRSPIAGIFLAKNHFGYTNETTIRHEATPRTAAALQSAEDVAQRYAAIIGAMQPSPPALEGEIIEVDPEPEPDDPRAV